MTTLPKKIVRRRNVRKGPKNGLLPFGRGNSEVSIGEKPYGKNYETQQEAREHEA